MIHIKERADSRRTFCMEARTRPGEFVLYRRWFYRGGATCDPCQRTAEVVRKKEAAEPRYQYDSCPECGEQKQSRFKRCYACVYLPAFA